MSEGPTTEELQQQLHSATEALRDAEVRATAGRFALELMHEIKNPLETVSNLTYLAKLEADDAEKVRRYMALAAEQMTTVAEISSSTLGFAQVLENPKPFDLVQIVEAAVRIHQRTIDSNKVNLTKDLPAAVVASVHSGEILQVMSNLIVNALDALPAYGTICLRLRKRAAKIDLLASDNGCGIPHEHHDRLFEPFFTTEGPKGNGLGLALSKRIVERHRGHIKVRSSDRKGSSGTTFRVSLPA